MIHKIKVKIYKVSTLFYKFYEQPPDSQTPQYDDADRTHHQLIYRLYGVFLLFPHIHFLPPLPPLLLPLQLVKLYQNVVYVLDVVEFVDDPETLHQSLLGNVKNEDPEFEGFAQNAYGFNAVVVLAEVVEVAVAKVDEKDGEVLFGVVGEDFLEGGEVPSLFLAEELKIVHNLIWILLDSLHFCFDFDGDENEFALADEVGDGFAIAVLVLEGEGEVFFHDGF